ncbi:MAG: hypothetical protein M1820_000560 [Bogoriella megaspora]|nr:MAG: hypothetical protein M1820_000560 [Bogoriella megaspora]
MTETGPNSAVSEGRVIVRRYTEELPGEEALQQAVGTVPETPWGSIRDPHDPQRVQLRRLFQDSDLEDTFWDAERERRRLVEAWTDFQIQLPEPARKKWQPWRSKDKVNSQLRELNPVALKDVENTIDECQEQWVKKDRLLGGKIQATFHKICKSLDSYSGIFQVFPSQNTYVSVLCGSLKMIIQASVTHVETGDAFSSAFRESLCHVETVMIYVGLMDVEPMRRRVSELYGKLFEFIRFAMTWWSSSSFSKFRDAAGRGLYERLQSRVAEMKTSCEDIDRQARARGLAENRDLRITAEDTNRMVHDLQRRQSLERKLSDSNFQLQRDNQSLRERNEKLLDQQSQFKEILFAALNTDQALLGERMSDSLLDIWKMREVEERRVPSRSPRRSPLYQISYEAEDEIDLTPDDRALLEEPQPNVLVRDDALSISQSLEQYIFGTRLLRWSKTAIRPTTSGRIADRLQRWSKATSSQFLWVIGVPDASLPSNMASLGATITATAQKLNLHCISHFCELPGHKQESREQKALLGLVYSLIAQLLEQMPPLFQTSDAPITASRFAALDGTMSTWQEALTLFQDLLKHNPWPLLLCVIDGLTRLDFKGGSPYCEQFVSVLFKHYESSENITKVLLTSAGNTGKDTALSRQIPEAARVRPDGFSEQPFDVTNTLSAALS